MSVVTSVGTRGSAACRGALPIQRPRAGKLVLTVCQLRMKQGASSLVSYSLLSFISPDVRFTVRLR